MFDSRMKRALLLTFTAAFAFSVVAMIGVALGQDDAGQAAFTKRCASCHGADGKGETKAGQATKTPNILTAEWKNGKTQEALEKTLREGLGKMPKYEGKMTPEEIAAVAKYTLKLAGGK